MLITFVGYINEGTQNFELSRSLRIESWKKESWKKEFDFRFGLSYIITSDFNRWHKKMCQSKNIEINAVKSRETEFGTSVRVQNCHFNYGKD